MPSDANGFHILDTLLFYITVVGAYLIGETGKIVIAGAMGGMIRVLISNKRRIRDAIISAIAGAVMAKYATPIMLTILETNLGVLKGDAAETAGFATGLAGLSFAKIVLAYVEAKLEKIGGEAEDA